MSTIEVTSGVEALFSVEPNPLSSITKYFPQLDHIALQAPSFVELLAKPVDKVSDGALVTSGFSANKSVPMSDLALTLNGSVSGSVALIKPAKDKAETSLLDSDPNEEGITFKQGQCYLSMTLNATASAGLTGSSGKLNFGIEAGTTASFTSYQRFEPVAAKTLFGELLRRTIAGFAMPVAVDDLRFMAEGTVTIVDYTGRLTLSASADLLASVNPLASVDLPSQLGSASVTGGGRISVSASFEVEGEHQIRVHKRGPNDVMLGYYRKAGSNTQFGVTASAGVAATAGNFELFSTILERISPNAKADEDALKRAGLNSDRVSVIQGAVKTAIDRKLELSLSDQLSLVKSHEASFLFHIDLRSLGADGMKALTRALHGDLTALPDNGSVLPAGIKRVKSIFTEARKQKNVLKVNLLGILNVFSISELTLTGRMVVDDEKGEITILDQASASRISGIADNFRLDDKGRQKLRRLLAESFLLTVAYSASGGNITGPKLGAHHSFFRLIQHTNRHQMIDHALLAKTLGLKVDSLIAGLDGLDEFGTSSVDAETSYSPELTPALFLDANQQARSVDEYEQIGLQALLAVVQPNDQDKWRRIPAEHPGIFRDMKRLGNPHNSQFRDLFPLLSADQQVPVIGADYLTISWWSASMHRLGVALENIQGFLVKNQTADLKTDPVFASLRHKLADQLKQVASNAREEFGAPWGLVAMYLASGRRAGVSLQISNSKLAGAVFAGQSEEREPARGPLVGQASARKMLDCGFTP